MGQQAGRGVAEKMQQTHLDIVGFDAFLGECLDRFFENRFSSATYYDLRAVQPQLATDFKADARSTPSEKSDLPGEHILLKRRLEVCHRVKSKFIWGTCRKCEEHESISREAAAEVVSVGSQQPLN